MNLTLTNPETPYLRPVIPVTLALLAGIGWGAHRPGYLPLALMVLLVAGFFLFHRLRQRKPGCWAPLLAVAAAGYLSMVPWISPHYAPDHIVHYLDDDYWRVQATVVEPAVARLGRARSIVAVDCLSRDHVSRSVRGRIRLTVMGRSELARGDRICFPARLRPFRNFQNPGAFDYRRHMAFQGIHASAWVRAERIKREERRTVSPVQRRLDAIRDRLGRLIDTAGERSAAAARAVLKALVYGDRSGIDNDLRERFNRAGVGHLLAISGLHVGIVASVAFAGFRWLFALFPALLWRGWGRRWAAAATLLPVLAYGVLAGMSASTQRAEIMVGAFLGTLIIGRGHDILNTLAVAALIILLIFPPALFSISFQLSFAAVVAIAYGLRKIAPMAEPAGRRRPLKRVAAFILVSALAIAGTTPVVLAHFNQTSLVGIAANLVLIPLAGFLAVPLGLFSALLAWVFEPAAQVGFRLALETIEISLAGVDVFAGLPFAAFKTVTPSFLEITLYYLTGWAVLNLRNLRPAPWVLAASLLMATADGLYWATVRFWHSDLRVTAIDVGQGGATLLELPGGQVFLVDGGGFSDNRLFDMGQRVVAPFLWRKKIATVDILVLSHPDADHLNGLIYVARHFNARELWTNGDAHATFGYQALMAACRENGIQVRQMTADACGTVVGGVHLAVLHPPAGVPGEPRAIDRADRNDDSLVLKATFGTVSFLLTGDITMPAEQVLVTQVGEHLASTVLFAPHHGSRTSSSPVLIDAVRPDWVLVSAGAGNRFGFPHPEVIDRYRRSGCRIVCTCTHGAALMRTDGRTLEVDTVVTAGDQRRF
ncbi:DNA internalization-related competence protein ComEC/Rec2 [Desulfosarcina ovata]|nr:DNA internalization-related competence protein ComEC/Rec2 [Desulfosarcina ovata]